MTFGEYTRRNIDGVELQLNVALESLNREAIGEKPFWIKCPLCTKDAVIPVLLGRVLQSTRCRNCSMEAKVRLYDTGEYKLKCELGVLSVTKTGETWTQRRGI